MKTLKLQAPEASEAEIQAALIHGLQRRGWLVVRVNSGCHKTARGDWFRAYIVAGLYDANGKPAISGFPDVLALRCALDGADEGAPVRVEARLFEVKKLGGKRSEAQERFAKYAAERGVRVEVVEGWDAMEAAVARAE